jgi:hypothetical protein
MPKIRDLGVSFIPETRQPELNGVFAAAKKKPPACYGQTNCVERTLCPDVTGNCPDISGCLVTGKCGVATNPAKCAHSKKPPTKKKKTISRNAVEQLHAQMQQKIAHTDLTK